MTFAAVPADRVRIFSRRGAALAEFQGAVERSWIVADEGRAAFAYPTRNTDLVRRHILEFGNWLLVENSLLEPWVGVIDYPRTWSAKAVEVVAYTPEHIFGWRRGPIEMPLKGTAGAVFEQMIARLNTQEATLLRPGSIWKGGAQIQQTLIPETMDKTLQEFCERTTQEYSWRPVVEGSKLVVYADWSRKIGKVTTALLHEGTGGGNVEAGDNLLVEDGPIYNDLMGYGEGMTWRSKPRIVLRDAESRHRYGLRQSSIELRNITSAGTLKTHTKAELDRTADGVRNFKLTALNVADKDGGSLFSHLKLGNRMSLRLERAGFQDTNTPGYQTEIRILGVYYDPGAKGKLELVVTQVGD